MGLWLTTWQRAFMPQTPGHGSTHFWPTQAVVRLHSELMIHSGLQSGGLPKKSGLHEHTQAPLSSLFWLLGPQGSGLHGSSGTTASKNRKKFHPYKKVSNHILISADLPVTGTGLQDDKGSPVKPFGQLHIGLWEETRQIALAPQDPGHGSLHFCCIQALSCGQSLLMTHSEGQKWINKQIKNIFQVNHWIQYLPGLQAT